MKTTVTLKGKTPYSQSRKTNDVRGDDESWDQMETRCWKNRAHVGRPGSPNEGQIVVPIFALKSMLDSTAVYLGEKLPGDAKRTYSKIFASGIMLQADEPLLLIDGKPITSDDLIPEWINANSDGKRGSGKRVPRCYPIFHNWSLTFEIEVLDPRLSEEVLLRHLVAAGKYMGIGRYRAQNGGHFGRFDVFVNGKQAADVVIQRQVDDE